MELTRRKLIGSLASLLAAPAIVRVSSIMPVKAISEAERWTASWWTKVPGSGEWKFIEYTGTYAHCIDVFKTQPIEGAIEGIGCQINGQWVFDSQGVEETMQDKAGPTSVCASPSPRLHADALRGELTIRYRGCA